MDQICFSLSCKYTFCCFQSYVESRGGTLSQLLPLCKRPMLSSNSTKWSRTELLVRLQRDRWKYCNQCWALHPTPHGWRCDRIGCSVSSLAVQNVALLGLKVGSALRCTLAKFKFTLNRPSHSIKINISPNTAEVPDRTFVLAIPHSNPSTNLLSRSLQVHICMSQVTY